MDRERQPPQGRGDQRGADRRGPRDAGLALAAALPGRWAALLSGALAVAVAFAFADSSIVVLGLPEIYLDFGSTIPGVSWVVTSYNLLVAVVAFAMVPLMRRAPVAPLGIAGALIFLASSIGCSVAGGLELLIVWRSVQGVGAALLLAASLPGLIALTGSAPTGRARWGLAALIGAAAGPALGGVLTEFASWRAIFVAQIPVAALAVAALAVPAVRALRPEPPSPPARTRPWNLGLFFVFGALVGALFLAVLLVVFVWDLGPLAGAAVVSALPVAALLVRPLGRAAGPDRSLVAGGVLLALGLVALAFLPAISTPLATIALLICGAGFGLAVPPLSAGSVPGDAGLAERATVSVGARHVGLVAGLIIVAPLLAVGLERGGDRATVNATAVILDAPLGVTTKVPIALDLRDEFARTQRGAVPDLGRPFEENGAADDPAVAGVRDELLEAIRAPLTRGFRWSFLVAALFALLAPLPVLVSRRRAA